MIRHRLMKPAALAFMLAAAVVPEAPALSENLENCERGFEASGAGDDTGAIVHYTQCLETGGLGPESQVLAYFNRGTSYQNEGRYERSIADFDRVIELTPDDAIAFSNRGLAYTGLGQLDRAIADFDQALRLEPDFSSAFYNRGIAYSRKEQFDRALADYGHALGLAPDDAEVLNSRGNVFIELEKFDRAIAEFDRALALKPDFADAYNNRGNAYSSKGQMSRALADYDQAIRFDPEDASAYGNRGLTYDELGQKKKAIRDLKKMYALGDRSQILLSKLKELGAPPAPADGDVQRAAGTEAGTVKADTTGDRVKRLGEARQAKVMPRPRLRSAICTWKARASSTTIPWPWAGTSSPPTPATPMP